ncbi:hypothetical protein PInf_008120 [Phytophthora infestans]|nr:hypothetical protein PInf_008120 [Phytophthora infestans]
MDECNMREVCAFGVLALQWTRESNSLLVVPRGEQSTQLVELPEDEILKEIEDEADVDVTEADDLFESVEATVRKAQDAEACGLIQGGDLLVGINDNLKVVNLPFEQIVAEIKQLPDDEDVALTFMRLKWDQVFPLAVKALSSSEFLDAHGIHLREDETLSIREYALRMQALHGDCDLEERPPLLEARATREIRRWEALQGTCTRVAKHKYVKLVFALFPVWNPRHFVNVMTEYWNALLAQKVYRRKQKRLEELHAHRRLVKMRQRSAIAFVEFDFAKTVPLSGGKSSRLALVERTSVRLVAAPSLDDPCAVTSCVNWSVPTEFEKCCPLRLVALSASGNHVAVAGQRGFCLLNIVTGKWRMFGNVNDEQDMFVYSLLWVGEDAIVVNFTRFSEQHQSLHLQAYPRNHLDEESILEQLVFAREGEMPPGGRDGDDDCFLIMDTDSALRNLFCVSRSELWCLELQHGGTIKQNDLNLHMQLKRQLSLPSRVAASQAAGMCSRHAIVDFAVLPRFLHVQDDKLREQQQRKYRQEREHEQDDAGWLSSVVNMLVGEKCPTNTRPNKCCRGSRSSTVGRRDGVGPGEPLAASAVLNVSTMARLFVTCASWPAPCRLIYGLYGPDGMKVWLPLLDGVYMTHTKAFEQDSRRLETFLACHDPLRAKTYEIEFGTAPATAELYDQVLGEYGITLDGFLSRTGMQEDTTIYGLCDVDRMLRFDYDVKVLGAEQAFGLLVGVSQDVYVPSGVLIPCYDVFTRVPADFPHAIVLLVQNEQLSWARLVLSGVRRQFALSTPTQELFLHSMLEACYGKSCPEEKLHTAIKLLRPDSGDCETDIAEYCEIVAHVARKSEPSRLKVLFPAAGDPMDLLAVCQRRSELRTAANFLLILEECSSASGSSLPLRMESAAELLRQCVDQEEWLLAQHVVRVARDWEHHVEQSETSIDEQLAALAWDNLVRGEYERVVWCVEDLQAKLPRKSADEREAEDSATILDRLYQTFIQGNKRRQLRILLQAVTEAHYEDWVARIKHVMEQ